MAGPAEFFLSGVILRRFSRRSPNFQKGFVCFWPLAFSPQSWSSRLSWLPKVMPATLIGNNERRKPEKKVQFSSFRAIRFHCWISNIGHLWEWSRHCNPRVASNLPDVFQWRPLRRHQPPRTHFLSGCYFSYCQSQTLPCSFYLWYARKSYYKFVTLSQNSTMNSIHWSMDNVKVDAKYQQLVARSQRTGF